MEKLCEYFNDLGILQLNDVNTFLKIYSNISPNNYENKNEKIILALFSYLSLITKNDQHLYEICKDMIDSYSNNQIINRYKGLNIINNIFRTKLYSRFNLFLFKINQFLFIQNNKNQTPNNQKIRSFTSNKIPKDKNLNTNYFNNYENKNNFHVKNGKVMKKSKIKDNDKINDIIYKFSKEDEFGYMTSPPFVGNNPKSKPKSSNNKKQRNIKLNSNYDEDTFSPYRYNHINNINDFLYDNKYKFCDTKFNINNRYYCYNNRRNNEKEKIYDYYNNINNINFPINPNYNSYNKFIRINSRNNQPFNYINYNNYSNYNDYNNLSPYYYDNNYNFYQKQQAHLKKVEAKIIQLKAKQINDISEKCTFSPLIHKSPKYKNKRHINRCLTSINLNNRKYNINDKVNSDNNSIKSQNLLKMKENINKIIDDYMSINSNNESKKEIKKSRNKSYSSPKLKNNNVQSTHIDKAKEYENERAKMFTFKPNINSNYESKGNVIERLTKLPDKKNDNKKEELNKSNTEKKNKRPKSEINLIVKRLTEKKEKKQNDNSKNDKKKNKQIINWDERFKKHKKSYPQDYKNNNKPKKIKNIKKDNNTSPNEKIEDKKEKDKNEEKIDDKKEDKIEDRKGETSNGKNDSININNNGENKNNGNIKKEDKKDEESELNRSNTIYNSITSSVYLEEKRKELEKTGLLNNMQLNSRGLQGIRDNNH